MLGIHKSAACITACLVLLAAGCTGQGDAVDTQVAKIFFETTQVTDAGAGQFYSEEIRIGAEGNAALPDRFELDQGVLPPGLSLINDRGLDAQGNPDPKGTLTGHARVIGYAREQGSFTFTVKAISTGALGGLAQNTDQPDLTVSQEFTLNVGEGSINFITPTAAEGTADPAVPAFPEAIDFVNPANPNAFYSFPVLVAGGSGNNLLNLYLPRELGLSVFDEDVVNGIDTLDQDTDETAGSGSKMENHAGDGGWFVLQAGNSKVQVGGFQSPRGVVGTITTLDPDWFQRTPGDNGPALNSRRTSGGNVPGGDTTLGTPQPVNFSDYFHDRYEGTHPSFTAPPGQPDLVRRKYPFTAAEYHNAFFMPFTEGVHLTPLRFRMIAQAIDTRGTVGVKTDDVISRKAYAVQVQIPDIVMDTVFLPAGTAGIEYTVFINASGGVPPLELNLEYVDSTIDGELTENGPGEITKASFGVEADSATGQFFGIPNASGVVEFTLRASAAVMNPVQGGSAYVPTPNPGEFNGTNPVTGKAGIHRTIAVFFATPSAPLLTNASLTPGVDGQPYPGDRLVGSGGVPKLIPAPVGFTGTYPASQVSRNYTWTASYVRDSSHPGFEGTPDPDRSLPNALDLDGDANSPTSGQISGTAYDRGFHPVSITQTDSYLGDVSAPSALNNQVVPAQRALSISPDTAVYLRGVPKALGGVDSGLLDDTAQMSETRMAPLFLAAGLHRVETGKVPELLGGGALPAKMDILPVLIPNGGSDAHVDKSIPSVSGFWPAEAGKLEAWRYYYYGASDTGWKHLQQETTWIQTNTPEHTRVYLFAETKIKKFGSGSSGADSKRYQQYDPLGKRGILCENPLSGEIWAPAILDNAKNDNDGSQFGAEHVLSCRGYSPTSSSYGYVYGPYYRYYGYSRLVRGDREVQLQGLGSYIEALENSYTGRQMQGRTATSVAISADGKWGATAMPGGDEQKILLWRNDKQPIPAAILAQPFVTPLNGKNADGSDLANSACIFSLGSEWHGGEYVSTNQRYLLPDSLMFVRDGLLFLMERHLDVVFGLSLADGHLSSKYLNSRTSLTATSGTGPDVNYIDGQYVPDTDIVRGMKQPCEFAVQHSFAGNAPAAGEEGPDKVAFVAGDNASFYAFADYSGSYTQLTDQVRMGYSMAGNRNKSLLFLETRTGATGLDLDSSTLKDLTGNSSYVYGDLLTPGRHGEEQDFLAVSPDGNYVAVVRDQSQGSDYSYSYYGRAPTFATTTTSSTYYYYVATDDLILVSTQGADMDSSTSTVEPVLYVGTGNYSSGYTGTPSANNASWVSGRSYLNAKGRRISGVRFAPDNRTLILHYQGDNTYWTKYYGSSMSYAINAFPSQYYLYQNLSGAISLRLHFRTAAGGAINYPNDAATFFKNNLDGLTGSGISSLGDLTAPFTVTSGSSRQQFWATFRSYNGKFQYYISDQISGRNYLVGFNMTGATINGHAPYKPFTPHDSTIGFEQFDCNAWNYENRFFAVPAGVTYQPSGRDGAGIVFLIGSDASAGSASATDLEVYAFDANVGGDLQVLTSAVTTGTQNAINHMFCSADGNFLAALRSSTISSNSGRSELNGESDLIVVTNVHAALGGAVPNAFILSEDMSHGSTVAFVGDGSATGAQALIYSSAAKGANQTWDDRTLKIALLAPGAVPEELDATKSHYVVMGGARKLDDNPNGSD